MLNYISEVDEYIKQHPDKIIGHNRILPLEQKKMMFRLKYIYGWICWYVPISPLKVEVGISILNKDFVFVLR